MTDKIVERGTELALKNGGAAKIQQEILETEQVFIHWLDDMGASPMSLAKRSGVPTKQVKEMLASGVFQKKYLEYSDGFTEVAAPYLKARAQNVMEKVVNRLEKIIDYGEDKDAISAGRLLSDMASTSQSKVETSVNIDARVLKIAADGFRDMDQVNRALSAQMDSNIIEATEVKTARRK